MTVVTIRCPECGEVKPREEIQHTREGVVCDDCRTDDRVQKAEERAEAATETVEEDDEGTDQAESEATEAEANDEQAELTPEDFSANDARSW